MPEEHDAPELQKVGEDNEGVKFLKPKADGSIVMQPEIRVFEPQKEVYKDPNELIEEFRAFIKEDLQEGEVVHIRAEHAKQLARALVQAERAKMKEVAKEKEEERKEEEWENEDLTKIILKEFRNVLIVLGAQL